MRRGASYYKGHWDKVKAAIQASQERGEVRVWSVGRRLHVSAAFTDEFRISARELSGVWRPRTNTWTFAIEARRLVVELCTKIWGPNYMLWPPKTEYQTEPKQAN